MKLTGTGTGTGRQCGTWAGLVLGRCRDRSSFGMVQDVLRYARSTDEGLQGRRF